MARYLWLRDAALTVEFGEHHRSFPPAQVRAFRVALERRLSGPLLDVAIYP
jgi:hypothetical protein